MPIITSSWSIKFSSYFWQLPQNCEICIFQGYQKFWQGPSWIEMHPTKLCIRFPGKAANDKYLMRAFSSRKLLTPSLILFCSKFMEQFFFGCQEKFQLKLEKWFWLFCFRFCSNLVPPRLLENGKTLTYQDIFNVDLFYYEIRQFWFAVQSDTFWPLRMIKI